MAITQSVTISFLQELLTGTHDFSTDVFKIALYDSNASMDSSTTAYSATDEVVASGYTAGGAVLTATTATNSGVVYVDFTDATWTGPVTASGALIYNSSKANRSVAVLSFGGSVTKSPFTITFPNADQYNAILRFGAN